MASVHETKRVSISYTEASILYTEPELVYRILNLTYAVGKAYPRRDLIRSGLLRRMFGSALSRVWRRGSGWVELLHVAWRAFTYLLTCLAAASLFSCWWSDGDPDDALETACERLRLPPKLPA